MINLQQTDFEREKPGMKEENKDLNEDFKYLTLRASVQHQLSLNQLS